MAHGDAREKWRGNKRMELVTSKRHVTTEHGLARAVQTQEADVHSSPASSRLNWRPRRFKWTRLFRWKTKSGFCACAITFQKQSTNTAMTGVQATGYPQHFTKFHSTTLAFQPTQRKQICTYYTKTAKTKRSWMSSSHRSSSRLRRRPLPSTARRSRSCPLSHIAAVCSSTSEPTSRYTSENKTTGHWYTAYKLRDNIRLTASCRTGCAFLSNTKYTLYFTAIYN
jgi:hypothetical protein